MSTRLVAPIEPRPRARDLWLVLHRPFAKRFHRLRQAAPEIRQFVVDPRRDSWKHRARDQPGALKSAQRQSQHPLRDAADHALELVEAPWTIAEAHDDEHAPFVAD